MTLLVLDIRIPELGESVTNGQLWSEILKIIPVFASYALSFGVVGTFWIAHNFVVSQLPKNHTRIINYLNIPFLFLVALMPFSAYLLGRYPGTQVAIVIYGANVILTSVMINILYRYIIHTDKIENIELSKIDKRHGLTRTYMPIVSAVLAIAVSFIDTHASIIFFMIAIVINLIPGSVSLIDRIIFRTKDIEERA